MSGNRQLRINTQLRKAPVLRERTNIKETGQRAEGKKLGVEWRGRRGTNV